MGARSRQEDARAASPAPLPADCCFTMQQWLYRRTSHTRRYKRCYIVLHHDRLYSFKKPPSCRDLEPDNLPKVLRQAAASWMIAGAELKADAQAVGGFYKWKLTVRTPQQYVGDVTAEFLAVRDKMPLFDASEVERGQVNDIFKSINEGNCVSRAAEKPPTDDGTVWLATSNYKVALDWIQAVLWTTRYGSLRNFVAQNAQRTKYLAYQLPLYLQPLNFFPNSANAQTSGRRNAAFTFMKLSVVELLHVTLPDDAPISCVVEHNSSFYVFNLPRGSGGVHLDVPKAASNLSVVEEGAAAEEGGGRPNEGAAKRFIDVNAHGGPDEAQRREASRNQSLQVPRHEAAVGGPEPGDECRLRARSMGPVAAAAPTGQGYNMLSKLWNYNKASDKRKVVMRKQSHFYGEDACVYIPIYKNTVQDLVWIHFIANADEYVGSAAVSNCDFSISEPAALKTCVLKHVEAVNPLNHKRVDISDHPNPLSVVNKSTVNAKVPEPGYVVLSVVTPKRFGNFLDPVAFSHNSPKEYMANASKASTAGGIHMLTANIRRFVAAYRSIRTLLRYSKAVVQFRDATLSVFWLLYCVVGLGFFPDKLLFFLLMPLIYYTVSSHPDVQRWIADFLLTFPLLIALLPKRATRNLLLLPKQVCIVCTKRKTFLQKNSHAVAEEVKAREIVAQRVQLFDLKVKAHASSGGREGGALKEQIVRVERRDKPLLTENRAMNAHISYTALTGTHLEQCNHRGIVLSYLAALFMSQLDVSDLAVLKRADRGTMVRGLHSIFYYPPPYPWDVVPWKQNVILTLKYYAMAALLTFSGGINDVQTLHLLHRNRVATKLNIEAVKPAPDESHMAEQKATPEASKAGDRVVLEWYENERKSIFGVYSKDHLRFYDRPPLSAEDGSRVFVLDAVLHNARVVKGRETDGHGWMYSKNWNSVWQKESHTFTFVRRRRWTAAQRGARASVESTLRRELRMHPFGPSARNVAPPAAAARGERGDLMEKIGQLRDVGVADERRGKRLPITVYRLGGGKGETSENGSPVAKSDVVEPAVMPGGQQDSSDVRLVAPPLAQQRRQERDAVLRTGGPRYLEAGIGSDKFNPLAAIKKRITKLRKASEAPDQSPANKSEAAAPSHEAETKKRFTILGLIKRRSRTSSSMGGDKNKQVKEVAGVAADPGDDVESHELATGEPEITPIALPQVRDEEVATCDDVDDWETDVEEEEEAPVPTRSGWVQNLVKFALTLLPCVVLDIFEVMFKIIWVVISLVIPLPRCLGGRKERRKLRGQRRAAAPALVAGTGRPGCSLTLHGGRYTFHVRKVRRCCFMGSQKARIYSAAQGHRCPAFSFAKARKCSRANVLFLHTRTRQVAPLEHDAEDDEFEVYAVLSDEEGEQTPEARIAILGNQTHEMEESETDVSSVKSASSGQLTPRLSLNVDEDPGLVGFQPEVTTQDQTTAETAQAPFPQECQPECPQSRKSNLYSIIKNIYASRLRKRQSEVVDEVDPAGEDARQPSDYEGIDSDDNMETEHKTGVLGMLRKARDQIVVGNFYLNLLTMRYEKFLNMFTWRNPRVTQLVLMLFATLLVGNYLFSVSSVLLFYILLYFKSNFIAGTWERNIRHTVERHLDACLDDLELYKPFWDLTNRQVDALARAIHAFSQVEVTSAVIREAPTRRDLAQIVTAKIVEQKLCRSWRRRNWLINLFRHSPSQVDC
ncbi:uncharacterized protein BcabD6B2_46530 [Babesia caballi]|uniref:Membrane protein, putative n=1 Tax=Babesia caballi TaxID=5871 RepID=A0AAV4LYH8_BABCB|nr:membrane protein, putative [Babesia caballi]